jgi:DNA-binding transcriptional MerR regulator
MNQEYTIYEIALLLGIHPNTARKYARESGISGTLVQRKQGGKVRLYSEADLQKIQEAMVARVNHIESANRTLLQVQALVKQAVNTDDKESTEKALISAQELIKQAVNTDDKESTDQGHAALVVLEEVQAAVRSLGAVMEDLRTALAAGQEAAQQQAEAARQREEALLKQLAAGHEEARHREAELTARLDAIQEALERPWWDRWLRLLGRK